jgi:crotonobetainyl-CoA:carnitine CoA-transferase CaiB-like acyl-CoA transferase
MQALTGIRVLELGSTVAGPFCGRLLADFGADVVKVEPPGGDALRSMGKHLDGKSLYAASILRNKRLIAVDLSKERGRAVIKRLIPAFDILIENFRPGAMEKWGLGYDELHALHPGLIMVRISGFGQDGPYRERPGYGFLGDAVSGLLGITGFPDRPPVRAAVPVTDMLTALYAAYGASMALQVRAKTGLGQCIDAALYESSFSLMESHVPAFDKLHELPKRSGSRLPGSTPNNLYETKDGAVVAIAAASDSVFARLAGAMNQPALATDPRFAAAIERVKNEDALDAIIGTWSRSLTLDEIEGRLHSASVPASRVFTLHDIFADEHYHARNMLPQIPDEDLGMVTMVGPVPKLSLTPGEIRWSGRRIGEDTAAVLAEGGFTPAEVESLATDATIRCGPENAPADGPTRAAFVASALATFASIAVVRSRADAAPQFDFKFAHNVPPDHPFNVTMVQMWNAVNRETNGRLKMRMFPQNQLGSDPQSLAIAHRRHRVRRLLRRDHREHLARRAN